MNTKRKIIVGGVAVAATLTLALGGSATADHDPRSSYKAGCEKLHSLPIAQESRAGYDRDKFGDYDRQALLDESKAEHGDYYSVFDNKHYDDAGDVDVDHAVSLAEAWDSGASKWSDGRRDQFSGDTANLTLLTDEVNQGAKSDKDIAEWQPPYKGARGLFATMWVNVKHEYGMSVDQAEQKKLLELTGCPAAKTTTAKPAPTATTKAPATTAKPAKTSVKNYPKATAPVPVEANLPVTG